MMSTGELAALRREANRFLKDVCLIQTLVTTPNADGSVTQTYTASAPVACRAAPSGYQPNRSEGGGQVQELGSWVLTFPALTAVPKSARVVNQTLETTYEVSGVHGPRSDEITRRVYAEEAVG